jgi:hypothetical protein
MSSWQRSSVHAQVRAVGRGLLADALVDLGVEVVIQPALKRSSRLALPELLEASPALSRSPRHVLEHLRRAVPVPRAARRCTRLEAPSLSHVHPPMPLEARGSIVISSMRGQWPSLPPLRRLEHVEAARPAP